MPGINSYKVLYVLIHTLYTIIEFVWTIVSHIYDRLKVIYTGLGNDKKEIDHLQQRLSRISKIPKHLTVILGVEEYTTIDLANLICWCISVKIPYISFYDFKGNLKKQEEKLQAVVDSIKVPNDHIIWHSQVGTLHKNGFAGRKIHVKILTEEDGRDSIVNLTKTLVLNKEKDISIEKINDSLQKQYEFPDPDMGLVSGRRVHILNYPPWQLRLTEFFTVNSMSNITFSTFLQNLERFSKCEQRVGT